MAVSKERPRHWQIKKLGDVFTIERGGSPRPIEEYITNNENGINWIKIGDTKNVVKYIYHTKEKIKPDGAKRSRMVYEDDFILSNSMSFGKPFILKTTGCIHDGWLVIRKNAIIDNNYLYYILSSSFVYQQFSNLAKGSTVKNLNIEAVKQVEIKFPPLPEQLAIVSKIEELLSDLENGKQQLQLAQQQLKVYRQSLLKWAFESKELIPFEEFIETSQNGLSKRKGTNGKEYKVLRLADITNNTIDDKSPRKIIMNEDEVAKYKIKKDDLVCVRVNGSKDLVGKLIYVTSKNENEDWAFCDHFIRFSMNPQKALSSFFHFYFSTVKVRKYIHDNMVTSAGQNTVSQVTIKNVSVPNCTLQEQQIIVEELESRLTVCDKIEEINNQVLQQAETLRQSILKKAFEGRLI